jgi:hypothetical protein
MKLELREIFKGIPQGKPKNDLLKQVAAACGVCTSLPRRWVSFGSSFKHPASKHLPAITAVLKDKLPEDVEILL